MDTMDSILLSVKQLLGLAPEYTPFDQQLIIHINSALMTLTQLGVGPSGGFNIEDSSDTWEDFLGNDLSKLSGVKSYVYFRVLLMWDQTLSSSAMDSIRNQISEYEWRLNVGVETPMDKEESTVE